MRKDDKRSIEKKQKRACSSWFLGFLTCGERSEEGSQSRAKVASGNVLPGWMSLLAVELKLVDFAPDHHNTLPVRLQSVCVRAQLGVSRA